jgi:hypothetical protein
MQYHDDHYIYVNDRPVGYVSAIGKDELERHGIRRIGTDFNAESGTMFKAVDEKPLKPVVTGPKTAPTVEI